MRQLGNTAALLLGLALVAWSALTTIGADISLLAYKFSVAGRERSEVVLPGLLGVALVGYATFNLAVGRKSARYSESGSGSSPPEA